MIALHAAAFTLAVAGWVPILWRGHIQEFWGWAANCVSEILLAVIFMRDGNPVMAAVLLAFALIAAWLFWRSWRRRKRKHAASLLGAKSRVLRDALVRTMRRERKSSRVLRPHPVPS